MGLFDALMGINTRGAKAAGPASTTAGEQAINQQMEQAAQQSAATGYSLASGAGGGPMAVREAQRRAQQAQGQSMVQGQQAALQLQQNAANQAFEGQMQKERMEAERAQANAGALQRGIGTAVGAAAMMSDENSKEMIDSLRAENATLTRALGAQPAQAPGEPAGYEKIREQNRLIETLKAERELARQEAYDRRHIEGQGRANESAIGAIQDDIASLRGQPTREDQIRAALSESMPRHALGVPQPSATSTVRGAVADSPTLMSSPVGAALYGGANVGEARSWLQPTTNTPDPDSFRANFYGPDASASVSDIEAKEDIRDLGPIKPVRYSYKPEHALRMALESGADPAAVYADKREPRNGIIAQDLEKSPAFAPAVVERPDGLKAVDRDRALSEALAQLADMDKRQRRLERKL